MSEICSWLTCNSPATHGEYCFMHHKVYGIVPATKKSVRAIPKKSASMKEQDKEYKKFIAEFLVKPENKICNIQAPGCTWFATTINHLKRRFKSTKMNDEFVEPCCAACNSYIENNDSWARENGHLLSKYN